jgi:hypothetical protein
MQDGVRSNQSSRNQPLRLQPNKGSTVLERQKPCPIQKVTQTSRGQAVVQRQTAAKGDMSKLTCYKCGKARHIASDMSCPQYKKPEQ